MIIWMIEEENYKEDCCGRKLNVAGHEINKQGGWRRWHV